MLVLLPAASAGWVDGAEVCKPERSHRDSSLADHSRRQTRRADQGARGRPGVQLVLWLDVCVLVFCVHVCVCVRVCMCARVHLRVFANSLSDTCLVRVRNWVEIERCSRVPAHVCP